MYEDVKAVIFDLDGTIYHGDRIIDGALQTIEYLHSRGIKTFFMTNNSSKKRTSIMHKLLSMGIMCTLDDIYSSGFIASLFIKTKGMNRVFVSGTNELKEELKNNNIDITDDENNTKNLLIGFDTSFDYEKMTRAVRAAMISDTIIACNKERVFPGKDGLLFPGCGGIVSAIEWCSRRNADIIIGKPNTIVLEMICKNNNLNNNDILVVGDTYDSDIAIANNYGCKSILIDNETNAKYDAVSVRTISNIVNLFK